VEERRAEFDIKARDLVAAGLATAREAGIISRERAYLLTWGVVLTGMSAAAVAFTGESKTPSLGWAAFVLLATPLGMLNLFMGIFTTARHRKALEVRYASPERRRLLGRCVVTARPDGLSASWPGGTYHHPWSAVFWIRTDRENAYIAAVSSTFPVPRRAFLDTSKFDEFVEAVRGSIESQRKTSDGKGAQDKQ
jgi:hypothetical protein